MFFYVRVPPRSLQPTRLHEHKRSDEAYANTLEYSHTVQRPSKAPCALFSTAPFVFNQLRIANLCNPFTFTTLHKTPGMAYPLAANYRSINNQRAPDPRQLVTPMTRDIRNIAIIAHVDHGKTTLVDAMLHQSGVFRANQAVVKRVMDSNELERERGITILAKNCALFYKDTRINIVDTPGHSDFGGEVERALRMVDGVLLLVDASEGPLPQTRYVLQKALAGQAAPIVVLNKIDRADARPAAVLDEIYNLFIDLDATEDQLDFPVLYTNAKTGVAHRSWTDTGGDDSAGPAAAVRGHRQDHSPALRRSAGHAASPGDQSRLQRFSRDASPSPASSRARCAAAKMWPSPSSTASCRTRASPSSSPSAASSATKPKPSRPATSWPSPASKASRSAKPSPIALQSRAARAAGDRRADAGHALHREHLAAFRPRRAIRSPRATCATAWQKELLTNVSIRVEDTDTPEAFRVLGRGELQLAILIETMRREGFELMVGKPEIVVRTENGKRVEPLEMLLVDCPETFIGIVMEGLGTRRGELAQMVNHGSGRVRMEFQIPSRGLIGLRSQLLTETRGTALIHSLLAGWTEYGGEMASRPTGALVADRPGVSTAFALWNVQERGVLFIGPGVEVYEGMIVGDNAREADMDVNITKEKKQTNMRASSADEAIRLIPHRDLSLEQAIEWIADDEYVEVTPKSLRLRKKVLDAKKRPRRWQQIRASVEETSATRTEN